MTALHEPCPACDVAHDRFTWNELGMICGRCERHTGNGHQGHYWALCDVTGDLREFHFCCPDNCELETS